MSFDKLLEYGAFVHEDVLGSGWSLIEYARNRYWLHVRSKTILPSHSQMKGGEPTSEN